jgi:hypothetical protein
MSSLPAKVNSDITLERNKLSKIKIGLPFMVPDIVYKKNIVHENPIWKTYKVKSNHAKLIKTLIEK